MAKRTVLVGNSEAIEAASEEVELRRPKTLRTTQEAREKSKCSLGERYQSIADAMSPKNQTMPLVTESKNSKMVPIAGLAEWTSIVAGDKGGFENDGGSVLAELNPYAKPYNTIDRDPKHEPEYSNLQF